MSRILLIGYNPPPFEGHSKLEAANYRTWQFLQSLLDDGHTICLCADSLSTDDAQPSPCKDWPRRLVYHAIPFSHWGWARELQRAHDAFEPDCIVAVCCCLYATRLRTNKPIWMDIYGDPLTIIQAGCYRARSDRGIPTSIAFFRQVLQKGDVFSVCSTAQKHALVGELAMAGRLNWRSFGYEFVQVVLPGAPQMEVHTVRQRERSLLAHYGVGKDDFVVLWCGGYNTWTDVETLFDALEWAMADEPRVHYVSVGASTYLDIVKLT